MQKQKKRKKHGKKVIVGVQISNLQRLVYENDIPLSFINIEGIFDASLPPAENKCNVMYEIERVRKEMYGYAKEITAQVVEEKKKK